MGGKPTTQLLRHRDTTIEAVTKRRYHLFLAGKINEAFPDAAQEGSSRKRRTKCISLGPMASEPHSTGRRQEVRLDL